jgi:hypothetical protein
MSAKLIFNNSSGPAHQNAMPALHAVADTLLDHLAHGKAEEARRFMSVQHLSPIALGFVASCLFNHGVEEKDIEAVLLH